MEPISIDTIRCTNCANYDDIMMYGDCETCALRFSKKGEKINFKLKEEQQ